MLEVFIPPPAPGEAESKQQVAQSAASQVQQEYKQALAAYNKQLDTFVRFFFRAHGLAGVFGEVNICGAHHYRHGDLARQVDSLRWVTRPEQRLDFAKQ